MKTENAFEVTYLVLPNSISILNNVLRNNYCKIQNDIVVGQYQNRK